MKKQINQMTKLNRISLIGMIFTGIVLFVLTISIIIYFNKQYNAVSLLDTSRYTDYQEHYVFITEDFQDSFWDQVYLGAKEKGSELGIYVEKFGENLAVTYTKADLMEMAIAAKVDGIILEADQSESMRDLIQKATLAEIPVVTVMTDCYGSDRKSFNGLGSYNLGREYGRQIVKSSTKLTKKVLILMDADTDTNSQTILFSGISETLSNEGNHLDLTLETKIVSDTGNFSAEEAIRDIFLDTENLPDIIICLDEDNTLSAYQALIDYNLVGTVDIIGYYTSETILDAISKNIVDATISVDAIQIGKSCTQALNEYMETGHVNDFVTLDVSTVTNKNVERYLDNEVQKK